jgi:hypothetical protein
MRKAQKLRAVVEAIIARGEITEALAVLDGLYRRATTVRSRGGGARSKAKGRQFMLDVAALVTTALQLEPGDVFCKATSQGGCDLHLSPQAARAFPFSVEGKKQETLNIWAALLQAAANASPDRPPIVFFARAHSEMYVALSAEVFLGRLSPRRDTTSRKGDAGGLQDTGQS